MFSYINGVIIATVLLVIKHTVMPGDAGNNIYKQNLTNISRGDNVPKPNAGWWNLGFDAIGIILSWYKVATLTLDMIVALRGYIIKPRSVKEYDWKLRNIYMEKDRIEEEYLKTFGVALIHENEEPYGDRTTTSLENEFETATQKLKDLLSGYEFRRPNTPNTLCRQALKLYDKARWSLAELTKRSCEQSTFTREELILSTAKLKRLGLLPSQEEIEENSSTWSKAFEKLNSPKNRTA